jgi:predicted metal-dependent phosphotriesterase family hydrolase
MEMDQERMIMTVNGPISKEKFGLVLPHEHIFHSIGNSILTARKLSDKAMDTLQIEDLQEYRTNPSAFNGINLFLNSEDTAFRELQEVEKENPSKQFLVVDVTVRQEVEERTKLYNLSQRLNGDFITVTSCEFPQTKPEMNQNEEALRLAKTLETELLFGTNNIRAGAIYQQIHVLNSTLDTKHKLLAQVLALVSLQ